MGKHAIGGMRSMIVPNRKADIRFRKKSYLRNYAENLPSVDVAPVRHGRWEFRRSEKHKFNTDAVCTACNTAVDSHPENNLEHRQTSIKKKLRYCPNCGAKMDLEVMDSGQK